MENIVIVIQFQKGNIIIKTYSMIVYKKGRKFDDEEIKHNL